MCLLWQWLLSLNPPTRAAVIGVTRRHPSPSRRLAMLRFPLFTLIFGGGLSLLALTTRKDEMVVVAVASPRTRRHLTHLDKLPVGYVSGLQAKIIADRR